MSAEQENFEKLQKLLKLKRYEQPPPGYFNHFSTQVINRLEAAERSGQSDISWFRRMLQVLETNPVAAGVFGMSICGLLLSGITYSQHREAEGLATNLGTDTAANTGLALNTSGWRKSDGVDSIVASTDPVLSTNIPGASFNAFDGVNGLGVQQASFSPSH